MRLAIRLATMTSRLFLPRNPDAGITAWKFGPISVATFFPFKNTSAVSFTFPRSSCHAFALPAGLSKEIEYLAVPEKFFTSLPFNSVQEPNWLMVCLAGNTGPPFKNSRDQLPLMARASPVLLYLGNSEPAFFEVLALVLV